MRNQASTWMGIGFKVGGQLIGVGADSFCGGVMNFYHSAIYEVYVHNARLGPGMGGGIGIAFVFMLDCPKPDALNGQRCSDWGVGLQLGNNWGSFLKQGKDILKNISGLQPLIQRRRALLESGAAASHFVKGMRGDEIEAIKTATGQIAGAYDSISGVNTANPKLLVIDSPFPGTSIGVELSLYISGGFIEIQ